MVAASRRKTGGSPREGVRPERQRQPGGGKVPSSPERLQKILARAGHGSRRSCEGIILEGRVAVNGEVVIELGTKADPARDRVTLDGKRVRAEPIVYYAVNKPRGAISTTAKDAGRRVIDLVPPRPRVNPVGRLDVDSEGLMLLTNDGELTHRMTHPKYGLERVYRAEVKGEITDGALAKLRRGVRLAEGKTLPPKVRVLHSGRGGGTLEITLREGLNREVRRVLAAVGLKVKKLVRTSLGPLALGKLGGGESRKLTAGELARLRRVVSGPGKKPPKWLRRRKPKRGGGRKR